MTWLRNGDLQALRTTVGELRLNLTTLDNRITDVVTRVSKLEAQSVPEQLALAKFNDHVQNCEKINEAAARNAATFRRELRGYVMGVVIALLAGVGFLLYHGLPYTIR